MDILPLVLEMERHRVADVRRLILNKFIAFINSQLFISYVYVFKEQQITDATRFNDLLFRVFKTGPCKFKESLWPLDKGGYPAPFRFKSRNFEVENVCAT